MVEEKRNYTGKRETCLLERRDQLPIIRCPRMDHRHGDINHRGRHIRALRLELDDLYLREATIGRRLRHRREGEEVLGRLLETGKISKRGDTPCSFLIEETGRDRAGSVRDELQVGGVSIPLVDLGDGVEVALHEGWAAISPMVLGVSGRVRMLTGKRDRKAAKEQ